MKLIYLLLSFFLFTVNAFGQKAPTDSVSNKEGIAIGEIGGASSTNIKSGESSFGYSVAVEATPIENWLELELGISSTYGTQVKDIGVDFLFKKPWTVSPKLEFMLGLGVAWDHATEDNITTNSKSGEIALDFMYWPFKKHQFGFYFEPGYEYSFSKGHEQSVGMSGGLLINIP